MATANSNNFELNQQGLWALQSQQPTPQVLNKGVVNDSDWTLFYTVPAGSFVQLQELLVYNGDSGANKWRVSILSPDDALPTGASADQPNVFLSGNLNAEESIVINLQTGLFTGWQIAVYSDAGAGVNLNMCLTGLVVTYL